MVSGTQSTLEWIKNKIQKPCRKIQPSERSGAVWESRASLVLEVKNNSGKGCTRSRVCGGGGVSHQGPSALKRAGHVLCA